MADSLAALGLELRAEAIAWLAALTPDTLPDGTLAAWEVLEAFGALEAEVAQAAAHELELARLQAWLTAGFEATPQPFAPADAVVAEVMEDARRAAAADAPGGTRGGRAGMGSADRADGGAGAADVRGGPGGASGIPGSGGSAIREMGSAKSVPWANEFAAGTTQSPPARTPDRDIPAPDPPRSVLSGTGASTRADGDRATGDAGRPGSPARGGIQGLAALAALAGRGGVRIPPEDADQPRGAGYRAAEPGVAAPYPPASPVDADRAEATDPHRAPEDRASAARSVDAAREVDAGALRLPPRIIRIPFTPAVTEGADESWTPDSPLSIPFLASPGRGEEDEVAPGGSPAGEARQPIGVPSMRVFDGTPAETAPAGSRESADAFLARAARIAGARTLTAAEVVAGGTAAAAAIEPVPAAQAVAGSATEPEPTVLAREGVPAARGPDPLDRAAPDVTELLDALASEIAHEYRRYYGE